MLSLLYYSGGTGNLFNYWNLRNMSEIFEICWKLSKFVGSFRKVLETFEICAKLSKSVENFRNLWETFKMCGKLS